LKLFVGIDIRSEELEVCFMDVDGNTLKFFKTLNNLHGLLIYVTVSLLLRTSYRALRFILVWNTLPSTAGIQPCFYMRIVHFNNGTPRYLRVTPNSLTSLKIPMDLDKTDRINAWIIADRLRFGTLTTTIIMQEQFIALQRLTRMPFHLVHTLTHEKQYFLQNLFYKCNAFCTEVDRSVFGHAIMEMRSEKHSLDEIANMKVEHLADFLKEKGKIVFPIPNTSLELLTVFPRW